MDTYKATNTINGKFYIGSTTDFERRKKEHLTSKVNYPFQNALRQCPEKFEWEVWSDDSDEPILEQALLDMWFGKEQCYNLSSDVCAPMRGRTGERNHMFGKKCPEHSERMRGRGNPMFGKKRPEVSERMSLRIGENHPSYGKKFPKHSEKMAERMLGEANPSFGKRWWVNPRGETGFSEEKPGPEWQQGRKWRG
jgi:group I intron endonuclease